MVVVKTSSELELLRESARIVALVHEELKKRILPGITTAELEELTEEIIKQEGGVPAFKGYQGYPYAICTSLNNVIVHGFPDARKLEEGDIIGIDVGVLKNGYYGDAGFTMGVGNISPEADKLIETSWLALNNALVAVQEGTTVGTLGRIINQTAQSEGFSVIKNYSGHGIGREMHEKPPIPNYGRDVDGIRLKVGMCICIEPMLCAGKADNHRLQDGWAVVTDDGSLACHVEHQIIVHKNYGEIISV
ncbi:MAG: type I methionyl aminopeptidase [Chloroflexota bacterium]|nr:MAG: type I methionyl aminopeptidase [Chloroflexota bacterium]